MHVKDFLVTRHILTDLQATDKAGLLRELSRRAGAALNIPSEPISTALLKREGLGSTGMGNGFAIPHACIAGVSEPFGMLVRLDDPVDFEAVDDQPVDLVFLLLTPEPSQSQQLNALASVARRLRDSKALQALRTAKDARAIYQLMTEDAAKE